MKKLTKREILKNVTDDKGAEALRLMPGEMQKSLYELTDKVNEIITSMEGNAPTDIPKLEPEKKSGEKEKKGSYEKGYADGLTAGINALKELQR
jgi:hypothetical protein